MTMLLIAYKAGLSEAAELRYSLRSIAKNLHMPDLQVTIVGDQPPAWLRPDLWIPREVNPALGKAGNISASVWKAARELGQLGVERAIYMDDDYFLLDPANSVMQVHGGGLDDHLERCVKHLRRGHWFTASMAATHRALINEMPNLMTFELHRPLPIDIDETIELLEQIQGTEVFWRSWYGNMSKDAIGAVEGTDGRYIGRSFPPGVPWVSSEDEVWTNWMGKKIAMQFPEASRWEQ
ncbi:hypothetical protein SEA_RASPUTIA_150 [Microbacterium phage Rasputia]|nr:hypothetical protein SEA_RASPUTIA_150 [Microbacterium phage Rasputia]